MKKKIFIILICFLTLFRLYITSGFSPFIRAGMIYDDNLFLDLTTSLTQGNWLGNYNEAILSKNIGFSLVLTLLSTLKMPYLLGINFIYIFACLIVFFTIKKIFKNNIIALLAYVFFLFNPISYALDTYLRVYRNNIVNLSFIMITISLFLNLIFDNKNKITSYIFLGIMMFLTAIMREDSVWLLFIYIIFVIYKLFLEKNNRKKKLMILIPVIILGIFINTISLINYFNYGLYLNNELQQGSYAETYNKILKIENSNRIDKVSINYDTLVKIGDISFSFKQLLDNFEPEHWYGKNNEVYDGYMIWALKYTASKTGYYDTPKEADEFWKNLNKEIDIAISEGNLKYKYNFGSILIPPYQKGYLSKTMNSAYEIVKRVISYENINIDYGYCPCDEEQINKLFKLTNSKIKLHKEKDFLDNYDKVKILKFISYIYRIIMPIIAFISFLLLIWFIFNVRNYSFIFSLFILLVSVSLLIIGTAYTNISGFYTILYYYLAPIYIIFNYLCLFLISTFITKYKNN